jgi:hypothetical protein
MFFRPFGECIFFRSGSPALNARASCTNRTALPAFHVLFFCDFYYMFRSSLLANSAAKAALKKAPYTETHDENAAGESDVVELF